MPFRHSSDPYCVLVSEVMLQQTQVARVMIKYPQFIKAFPTVSALAAAPLTRVLKVWQGMGYNRRALMLVQCAREVVSRYGGVFPRDVALLDALPGIGKATAAAVYVYAFNKPAVYIETNIRAVYIHHFFSGRVSVPDTDIELLVKQTMDRKNPREWFYALMDYGVMLKKKYHNPARRARAYARQSAFCGSVRQVRGRIVALLTGHAASMASLCKQMPFPLQRITDAMQGLVRDGLITRVKGVYGISEYGK